MNDKSKELLALAERVEQATGPDRELDALSHFLTNLKWIGRIPTWPPSKVGRPAMEDGLTMHIEGDGYFYGDEVPLYTASLDAAMSLVPEGHKVHCIGESEYVVDLTRPWLAMIIARGGDLSAGHTVYAATPALTLCAAALRARAHPQEVK